MAHAALISPMWLNAWGKFPVIWLLAGSTSSASRPPGPPFTGSPRDRAIGSRCGKLRPGPRDPSHADRDTTVRSELFKFPNDPWVSPARSGNPVEVLLVGHSPGGGVRVGVVEGGERLVRS